MTINIETSVADIAERMGSDATEAMGATMLAMLLAGGYSGTDTAMVDYGEWFRMATAAASSVEKAERKAAVEAERRERRSAVLLRAAYDLIFRIADSCYEEALFETVWYDDADCDGYCLSDDIEEFLELRIGTQPLTKPAEGGAA